MRMGSNIVQSRVLSASLLVPACLGRGVQFWIDDQERFLYHASGTVQTGMVRMMPSMAAKHAALVFICGRTILRSLKQ